MVKEYIVIAFTENQTGVLNRITTLYLRRKINIESLKVSESSIKGISMFVISAFTTEQTMIKLAGQLRNIIDVIDVEYYDDSHLIKQEIALYRISAPKELTEINELYSLLNRFNARIIEVSSRNFMVVERTGIREDIEAMREDLEQRGILIEFTRSGSVFLHREGNEALLSSRIKNLQ
ncbi:MAG: acetolactate synthase small subunit [Rikenellaceae bacterium]